MNILKFHRLLKNLLKKLSKLARQTHRSEELIDCQIVKDRLKNPKVKMISSKEMRER